MEIQPTTPSPPPEPQPRNDVPPPAHREPEPDVARYEEPADADVATQVDVTA